MLAHHKILEIIPFEELLLFTCKQSFLQTFHHTHDMTVLEMPTCWAQFIEWSHSLVRNGRETNLARDWGRKLSVIFDGTTRMGETLAILVCFVDNNFALNSAWYICNYWANHLLEKNWQEILTVLQAHYKVLPGSLLGAMHDRASVNNVAMNTVGIVFPNTWYWVYVTYCRSCWCKFLTPVLDDFVTAWVKCSHSPKSPLLRSNRVGFSVRTFCKTRWWSRWDVIDQSLEVLGDVEPFLVQNDDLAPRT